MVYNLTRNVEEIYYMKRLKKYLLTMDRTDVTYNAIYNGVYGYSKTGMILNKPQMEGAISDPEYWYDDISLKFERTNRKTPDLAKIRISIPLITLGINQYLGKYDLVLSDRMLRMFIECVNEINEELFNYKKKKTETGWLYIHAPNNKVLLRNSAYIDRNGNDKFVVLILFQFPINNHKKASKILCNMLPEKINKFIKNIDEQLIEKCVKLYIKQEKIREYLEENELCTFIANGSRLINSKECVPFISPKELECEIEGVVGLAIPKGITVIVGSGFSGKSTMLEAILEGIYNLIIEDDKRLIITVNDTSYIMAEDGRVINDTDISYFVQNIKGISSEKFTTDNASGSTSEAANLMESLYMGAKLLLIDEDKSAANFMVKDKRMEKIIGNDTLIPLSNRLQEISFKYSASIILVVGANYELLEAADTVILIEEYKLSLIKKSSKDIRVLPRKNSSLKKKVNIDIYDDDGKENIIINPLGYILLGKTLVKVNAIKSICSYEQLCSIGYLLNKLYWQINNSGGNIDVFEMMKVFVTKMDGKGLDELTVGMDGYWVEMPRVFDLFAVMNRIPMN